MYTKKRHDTSDNVYLKLREQILHLELPPGTAVSEIETAARYNVSRTPVRDAFKTLEREGLLEIRPHIGTFVTQIDLHMISDILYMRETLEQAVFKELAQNFDAEKACRLKACLQKQQELIESDLPADELSRAFILEDNDFHYALYELAGRENILLLFNTFNAQYERFRTFLNLEGKNSLQKLYREHTEIFRCIVERDYDTLEKLISNHIYKGFNTSPGAIRKHPEYFK